MLAQSVRIDLKFESCISFQKQMPNLMKDDRFSNMFSDPNFQVDMESEEFRLLNPLVSKLDKDKMKKKKQQEAIIEQFEQVEVGV